MKKHTNFTTEIESPIPDRLADTIIRLALYIALPLAVAVLVFDTIGGPDFVLWLATKV
jgi:uncharacterized RDD family membrane protein YckC